MGVLLAIMAALLAGMAQAQETPAKGPASPAAPVAATAPAAASGQAADAEPDPGPNATIETLRLGALDMRARHVRPPGSGLATMLLVHDTLGAFDDPLISRLQTALAAEGHASLAINLTLGVSARDGALSCNQRHTHRHGDALEEIDAWTDWLLGEGLGPVVLVGHGRGGAQAAWYLAKRAGDRVAAAVLLAPTGWTPRMADTEYRARYAAGLAALLTRIAGLEPGDVVENVPFLHCGAVDATKASIQSYYGVEPMRDTPTALASVETPILTLMPGVAGEDDDTARRLAEMDNPYIATRRIEGADAQFQGGAFEVMIDAIEAYYRSIFRDR